MPSKFYRGVVAGIGKPVTYKGPITRPYGNAASLRAMRAADPGRTREMTKTMGWFGPMLPQQIMR